MSTEAAFLRSISLAGDDFAPRLVFADWLDENGQSERAEFIRAQVLVATTPTDTPARRSAAQRAATLEQRFGRRWAGPLAKHAFDWQYRAGFPDLVGLSAAKLRRNGPKLFAHSPIRSLLVTDLAGDLALIGCLSAHNSITRLALWGAQLTLVHLLALAALPNLPRLHTLSLAFNYLDDNIVDWLIMHPFFTRLRTIELGANPITPATRMALQAALGTRVSFAVEREADYLYSIQNDDPFYNGITADGVQMVVYPQSKHDNVAYFDLAGNLLRVEERTRTADDDSSIRAGTVRVKRFTFADGTGIRGEPGLTAYFDEPATDPDPRFTHEVLSSWLHGGEFAIENMILDRSGAVTST